MIITIDQEKNVCSLSAHSDYNEFAYCDLIINGISVGSKYSDVINALGQTDEVGTGASVLNYKFNQSDDICISLLFKEVDGNKVVNLLVINHSSYYI